MFIVGFLGLLVGKRRNKNKAETNKVTKHAIDLKAVHICVKKQQQQTNKKQKQQQQQIPYFILWDNL